MKKLVMALVPALMFGCGSPADTNGDGIADGVQDPNNVSVVVPATPKGTISGQVLTTQQKPLVGATVSLTVGSSATAKTATSDDGGNFTFQDVPAGAQVLLTFSKDGFASLRASSIVPDSAGNVPINNGNASFGPVLLSELSGQVKINLIGPDGRPAVGAKGTLEVDPAGVVLFGLSEQTSSKVVVEAVADAQGVLTFDKVPSPIEANRFGAQYRLSVAAMDTNGDGVFETGGLVRTYSSSTLITSGTVRTESLPYGYSAPAGTLTIDYSNVASLKGGSTHPLFNMIKPGESVYIVFNQPVQANSVNVGLTDEYGKESIGVSKSLTNGNTVLTLTPSQGLQVGKEYNLFIRAVALNDSTSGGSSFNRTVAFFAGDPSSPQPINIDVSAKFYDSGNGVAGTKNNNQLDSGELVLINFNQVMTHYGSTQVQAFFDTDINNATTAVVGEWNPTDKTNSGFLVSSLEPPNAALDPTPVFSGIPFSGYTTRYAFTYGNGTTTYKSLNAGTTQYPMVIAFGKILTPSTDGYESGWGVPQPSNINVSVMLTAIPSP
jgi:hypothetical protein